MKRLMDVNAHNSRMVCLKEEDAREPYNFSGYLHMFRKDMSGIIMACILAAESVRVRDLFVRDACSGIVKMLKFRYQPATSPLDLISMLCFFISFV